MAQVQWVNGAGYWGGWCRLLRWMVQVTEVDGAGADTDADGAGQGLDGAGSILGGELAPLQGLEGRFAEQVSALFWNLRHSRLDLHRLARDLRRLGRNLRQVPRNLRQTA